MTTRTIPSRFLSHSADPSNHSFMPKETILAKCKTGRKEENYERYIYGSK